MIDWPIQEEELATKSYREVADNEMDLWIKVTKQLFAPSFGQLKLSFSNFMDNTYIHLLIKSACCAPCSIPCSQNSCRRR